MIAFLPPHPRPGFKLNPMMALAFAVLVTLAATSCAPRIQGLGPANIAPQIRDGFFTTADGRELPIRVWPAEGKTKAVILGLHGMNDYSNAFDSPARVWAAKGITTYAYDQRGFGGAPGRGYWPGTDLLIADVTAAARLLRERHPALPLVLAGISMGGAVAMAALASEDPPPVDGAVLSAPAVWGRRTLGFFKRTSLDIAAHTIPWKTFTGESLKIKPSDNIEMLRALSRDPKVIKATRVDAIYGLVGLMDRAFDSAGRIDQPLLLLYGENDELVPKQPTLQAIRALPDRRTANNPSGRQRVAVYQDGWHMLLRDLKADTVRDDVAAWVLGLPGNDLGALPSGADLRDADTLLSDAAE